MIFGFLFKPKAKKRRTASSSKSGDKSKKRKSLSKPKKRKLKKAPGSSVKRKSREELVGKITHFFPRVSAGVIKLKRNISLGDVIHIKGHTTDFIQEVKSLQINNKPVKKAGVGKLVGVLVKERVRRNDKVYKIKEK